MLNEITKQSNKIWGLGHILHIDEYMFVKRKYNDGRLWREQWVFGGIDYNTSECFEGAYKIRNETTSLPIIKEKIESGSTVLLTVGVPIIPMEI